MTGVQRLWWEQARSDHDVFRLLRSRESPQCHQLHYLQTSAEKLAKAYLWRDGRPPQSHASFVQFLRLLVLVSARSKSELARIAGALEFSRAADLEAWVRAALPLAAAIEDLAPALAGDGPNPEYPWPRENPAHAPVLFDFPIWQQLSTNRGRQFLVVLAAAVRTFPTYA